MTRLFLIILALFPACAHAANTDVTDYIPPPMFGDDLIIIDPYFPKPAQETPPLPPRRPEKITVPHSYIHYMRKHGTAPQASIPMQRHYEREISEDELIQPTAQDILDQIHPQ